MRLEDFMNRVKLEIGSLLCASNGLSHLSDYNYKISSYLSRHPVNLSSLMCKSEKNVRTPHLSRVWVKNLNVHALYTKQNLTWKTMGISVKSGKPMRPDKSK